jgi:multidrug resistance protein, MATE family
VIAWARLKVILDLAMPVTAGLFSSFVMAMVDLAMVGHLGIAAVAAVGIAGFTYSLVAAVMAGITPAVQGIVSRRLGEGSDAPLCVPLNAGLLLSLGAGVPIALLCFALVPHYFGMISPDPAVVEHGVPYLRALTVGMVFAGLNNAFHGLWAGVGRTKVYMMIIVASNLLNILLNYALIFGHFGLPALGTLGCGIATAIASGFGTLLYLLVTSSSFRGQGFLAAWPDGREIGRMLQIGVPAVMETAFFSLGFLVYYWIVGRMGTPELAASNVLVRLSVITDLFGQALGIAAITLVQRSLGEGDAAEAERWGWDIAKIGLVWITLLGAPILLFPRAVLGFFLDDPATIAMAVIPAQMTAACLGIASLIMIFATVLISLGDGKRVLLVSFSMQWLLYLPGVWIVGVLLQGGLLGITFVQMVYGTFAVGFLVALWMGGRWKTLKIS